MVITIQKTQENITNRKANEIVMTLHILIKFEQETHNTIIEPLLLMLKAGIQFKKSFKTR